MLTFIERSKEKFKNGTREAKRQLLWSLGQNLVLLNRKLNVDMDKSLLPIQKVKPEVDAIKKRLEPVNGKVNQEDFDALCDKNPNVLRDLDSNQGDDFQRVASYH